MHLPAALLAVLQAVRRVGRPRIVGGCVRDWLLGQPSTDFDIEVAGVDFDRLRSALSEFGPTDVVGRSFGVIKLRCEGAWYDFSLPRRESKTGAGHRGFEVAPDPSLSDAEAAARRDFTLNAIAYDPFEDRIIDPLNGVRDLRAGVLRHASPAFVEDPLRALRAIQFAARFDFVLAAETVALCRSIKDSFAELPSERVWGEWAKWAEKSRRPSRGLAALAEMEWLGHFPEIAALRGTPQDPEWHPEGDVFVHTQHCCDALTTLPEWKGASAADRRVLSFAVLAHDFGKPGTTAWAERRGRMRWVSPGHESVGGPLAESFLRRLGAPNELLERVPPLVVHHMAHHSGPPGLSNSSVRRLARKLAPATIEQLCVVMFADHLGRPPLLPQDSVLRIEALRNRARELMLEASAPKPIILGRHLLAEGAQPGPRFKPILDDAFEAQLEGAFVDEIGGVEWLRAHLRNRGIDLRSG